MNLKPRAKGHMWSQRMAGNKCLKVCRSHNINKNRKNPNKERYLNPYSSKNTIRRKRNPNLTRSRDGNVPGARSDVNLMKFVLVGEVSQIMLRKSMRS